MRRLFECEFDFGRVDCNTFIVLTCNKDIKHITQWTLCETSLLCVTSMCELFCLTLYALWENNTILCIPDIYQIVKGASTRDLPIMSVKYIIILINMNKSIVCKHFNKFLMKAENYFHFYKSSLVSKKKITLLSQCAFWNVQRACVNLPTCLE